METVRSSERQTQEDRARWKANEELFAGRMNWGQDDEGAEWQSRIFMHEFAPIIREATMAVVETVFQHDDFINLLGDPSQAEIARIREKLIKYYLMSSEGMRFPQRFYEFVLSGCTYGMATFKHTVQNKVCWKPEVIIEQVRREEDARKKRVKADNVNNAIYLPDGMEEVEGGLEAAIDAVLGKAPTGIPSRGIASKKRLELFIGLKLLNPHNYFWHADADDINETPWAADILYPKFFEILPYFEAGIFDPKKKEKLLNRGSVVSGSRLTGLGSREYQKVNQRDQRFDSTRFMPELELVDYYGPIPSPDGSELIEENAHVIIGNSKHLLLDSVNEYWSRRIPYQTSVFNRRPHKPSGAGVADGAAAQQVLINQLVSLFVDILRMDAHAPLAVNEEMLADPTQLEQGIRPGDVIRLRSSGEKLSARDAFSELPQRSTIAPQLIQTLEMLKLSGQKGSSINTMSSNPASRARITGAEVESNDSRRNITINSLGSELDYSCIEPLVRTLDRFIMQFGFDDENLQLLETKGVLTAAEYQLLSGMNRIERFEQASKHFKVEIRGFRAVMQRDKELRAMSEFLTQIPMFPPHVINSLQWPQVLKDVLERHGIDGAKWIRQNSPFDKAMEENALLVLGQQVGVLPDDEHSTHLPAHYQSLLEGGPNPAVISHIMGHLQLAQQQGQQIPPPPPEVAPLLGMMPTTPEGRQNAGSARAIEAGSPSQAAPRTIQ